MKLKENENIKKEISNTSSNVIESNNISETSDKKTELISENPVLGVYKSKKNRLFDSTSACHMAGS
jgi:hypothetical protein